MGDILVKAQRDWERFNKSATNQDITFYDPDSQEAVTVKGVATRHSIYTDTDGNKIEGPNVHVSVHENEFAVNAQYPVRDGETIKLKGHRISFANHTGESFEYWISIVRPDQSTGIITCICKTSNDGDDGINFLQPT